MKTLLSDIRSELEKISPGHFKIKKKYATKEEIVDFETKNKLTFPDELIAFWLLCDFEITGDTRIYSKLGCETGPSFFMFDEFEYLVEYRKENSGQEFSENRKESAYFEFKNREFKEHILTHKLFDDGWFPLAIDSFDGAICIDLNPGLNGNYGQLIYVMYIGDEKSGAYYSGYNSFTDFLTHYLLLLKDRKIEIEQHIVYPLSPFS